MTHSLRNFLTRATPAALLAVTMVLTVWVSLPIGLVHSPVTLLRYPRVWLVFLTLISVAQWLGVAVWAILTGTLFVFGLRGRPMRFRWLAALAGALVPVGLGLLSYAEGAIWPALRATLGPLDRPLLTLPLLLYCIAAPFGLGRLAALFPALERGQPASPGSPR